MNRHSTQPVAFFFQNESPPAPLLKLGLHIRNFDADSLEALDLHTAHWVFFVPATLLEKPEWNLLRVRLAQANRWFLVYGSGEHPSTVVKAMRDGAFDFVATGESAQRWGEAAGKAAESQKLWLELYGGHQPAADTLLVGKSQAIQSLVQTIQRIGPSGANVLIFGESGTGKEKAALALHETSGLSGPFVPVNCAAIPKDLIEAELFGAEKGAYTGAMQAREGLVEQAAGGTLFLDEIGELDLALQPKLLRFIESRRARRVGGRNEYSVEARILAATNRHLESRIEGHEFRADLFYRLSEIMIELPPLRAHREDVPLLALHFLNEANEKFGKNFVSLEPGLISAMMEHSWPGNARELRSTIHRMVVLHDGPVLRAEWWEYPGLQPPPEAPKSRPAPPVSTTHTTLNRRQKWERAAELLRESGNDRTWTAAQLGVHPATLFRWIQDGKVKVDG